MDILTYNIKHNLSLEIYKKTNINISVNEFYFYFKPSSFIIQTNFFLKNKLKVLDFIDNYNFENSYIKAFSTDKNDILLISLKPSFIVQNIINIQLSKFKQDKKVFIDFGGLNIAKPLHVGHTRSLFIGNFLQNIYSFFGYKTISDIHFGDWGFNIACIIVGIKQNLDIVLDIDTMQKIYVDISNKIKSDISLYNQCKYTALLMQTRSVKEYNIYKNIRDISVKYIKNYLKILGIHFDLYLGESDCHNTCIDMLSLFKKDNDSGYYYNLDNNKIYLTTNQGAVLYTLTDLATIKDRVDKYNFNIDKDKILYVIDIRQQDHIEIISKIASQIGLVNPNSIDFIGFNTVNMDKKPIKTRDGNTPSIEDTINQMRENIDFNLAVSSLKFSVLSNSRLSQYNFDPKQVMDKSNYSGVYVIYTAVRIKSLINNIDFKYDINHIDDISSELLLLLNNILLVYYSLDLAFYKKDPSCLCNCLYIMCKYFNSFYQNNNISNINNHILKTNIMVIVKFIFKAITTGLNILGISIPDKI